MADRYDVDIDALRKLATDFHSAAASIMGLPSEPRISDLGDMPQIPLTASVIQLIGDVVQLHAAVASVVDGEGTGLEQAADGYEQAENSVKSSMDPMPPGAVPGPHPTATPSGAGQ